MNPLNLSLTDPNVVQVNGNIIDTTAVDQITQNASNSSFIYIKAQSSINNDQYQQLTSLGVEVTQTISRNTYLCFYPNSDLESIRELPFVKTANVYSAAMKTTGALKELFLKDLSITNPQVAVRLHKKAPRTADQVAQDINGLLGIDLGQMNVTSEKIILNIPKASLAQIETIDSVKRIEEVLPQILHNEYARGILVQNTDYSSLGNPTSLNRWKGRDQVVCVADTGVDVSHRAFEDRIFKEINLWTPEKEKSTDPGGHGTHVAGSVAEGVARNCGIMVQGMWDPNYSKPGMYPRNDLHKQLIDAFDAGAHIHTDSWGVGFETKQEDYNDNATAMDKALYERQFRVVTISAGNSGGNNKWLNEIGDQNGCKNAITVGNSLSLRPNYGYPCCNDNAEIADPRSLRKSSSTGPTAPAGDYRGRIKPDVVAPGTAILSAKSAQMSEAELKKNADNNPASKKDGYIYMSGTSMSTPHVAGCCAVIREAIQSPFGGKFGAYWPSGALIKALLINGAIDLKGHWGGPTDERIYQVPDTWQGFGRVDLSNSILNIEGRNITDSGTGFGDAQPYGPHNWIRPLGLDKSWISEPIPWKTKMFSVTLCWYDPPGEITENMLNLTVKNKDDYHRGNQWKRNSNYIDEVNTVQKVVWTRQEKDEDSMIIEVKCSRMNPIYTDQSFAIAWMSHD